MGINFCYLDYSSSVHKPFMYKLSPLSTIQLSSSGKFKPLQNPLHL